MGHEAYEPGSGVSDAAGSLLLVVLPWEGTLSGYFLKIFWFSWCFVFSLRCWLIVVLILCILLGSHRDDLRGRGLVCGLEGRSLRNNISMLLILLTLS